MAGTGDYNGDGKVDILWRNGQTGEVDFWFMVGSLGPELAHPRAVVSPAALITLFSSVAITTPKSSPRVSQALARFSFPSKRITS